MRNPYPEFVWFFGTAEDTSSDPLRLGRVRVRATGFHSSSANKADLPYALVLNGGAARINPGQMVFGFFLDGEEAQQPCVMGVVGSATTSAQVFNQAQKAPETRTPTNSVWSRIANGFKLARDSVITSVLDFVDFLNPNRPEEPASSKPPNTNPVAPNSLGFIHPLGNADVKQTSDFGLRKPPRTRTGYGTANHKGVDMAPTTTGTPRPPVLATKAGVVTFAGYNSEGPGYSVKIDHGDGVETRYYHLTPGSITVTKGQEVKQGVQIGMLGNSGSSTAPHLHYEVVVNGKPVDPASYLVKKE